MPNPLNMWGSAHLGDRAGARLLVGGVACNDEAMVAVDRHFHSAVHIGSRTGGLGALSREPYRRAKVAEVDSCEAMEQRQRLLFCQRGDVVSACARKILVFLKLLLAIIREKFRVACICFK